MYVLMKIEFMTFIVCSRLFTSLNSDSLRMKCMREIFCVSSVLCSVGIMWVVCFLIMLKSNLFYFDIACL